jgi:hypothetical protein
MIPATRKWPAVSCGALAASALLGLALALSTSARADDVDFTGSWSISGRIVSGNLFTQVTPVCALQQAGAQLTGTCAGPNADGPATGLVDGRDISFQWRHTATTAIGVSGISSFTGRLERDNVIRGLWTISLQPGARGAFTGRKLQ